MTFLVMLIQIASLLLEEFRIAYRGWESYAQELKNEVQRKRPTIGDAVGEDIRNAIQQMREKSK